MRFLNTNKIKKFIVATLILAFLIPAFSSPMVSVSVPVEPQAPIPKPSTFSMGAQVPLADPHPFRVNFYDTTVSTEPNYPDGWAQAVDGNMNRYNYKGFIIPNVLTVVDEYYFQVAPTEYWIYPVEDIKIRISLNAHLWNRDLGFCSISIKNFNTDEWEVLRARVDTHDYKQVLHEFDKDDLEHSDNLYFYINSEEQVEIQIYSENYGCWQGLRYCPPGVYMGIDMATVEVLFSETPVASPQVPLADPHPFRVNFYDTTVSTEPNYPDGWAQAVDGNMNRYNYKGFIIPNVLTVVDEYYFHAAPTEYWKHPVEDIKIRISLNAHLWNRDLGFCSISIKNFNTDEWEVLRARVDTHDYKQVLHEFDKDDLEHSDNLYFYINSEEQVEIQIYSENYGCWQGLRYCPPGVYMGIDMATVEVLFSETPDTSPPALSLIEPSGSISGTYTIQPSVRDDETGVSKVEFYEDGALMGTATTPGYSFQWDTTTSTEGSHEVKVIAYNHAGLPREISMKVTVDNVAEKIAAFFWSTDAVTEYGDPGFIMGSYVTYIQRQGYRVYNFPDTTDFYADFHQVADAEGPKDTLFFFFKGHGDYIDGTTMSFSDTYLRAGYRSVISSIEFRELVLTHIETPRLAFLVESCYSGGWVDDFKDLPYLAMSSTDCYHPSVATDVILNFIIFVIYITTFSFMGQFFEGMILGVDARTCFAYASQSYENQNPQMSDNSPYDFF